MVSQALRVIVAEWLRAGMARAKIKQATLARQSGVSRDTIWRILHTETDAEEETLAKLSDALGWPLPELSGVTSHPKAPSSPPEARSDAEGRPIRAADRAAQEVFEEGQAKLLGRGLIPAEEAIGWLYRMLKAQGASPSSEGEGSSGPEGR